LEELSDQWPLDIVREVDMTNDRQLFSRDKLLSDLPLIEGRMVHQFRAAHKAYVSGTGRSAVWHVMEIGDSELVPQFRISPDSLSQAVLERADVGRIGFCDITGQTNERTMLAARIPAGSVCGNKVPTITFSSHPSPGDFASCRARERTTKAHLVLVELGGRLGGLLVPLVLDQALSSSSLSKPKWSRLCGGGSGASR
jgi:hypothetical protein